MNFRRMNTRAKIGELSLIFQRARSVYEFPAISGDFMRTIESTRAWARRRYSGGGAHGLGSRRKIDKSGKREQTPPNANKRNTTPANVHQKRNTSVRTTSGATCDVVATSKTLQPHLRSVIRRITNVRRAPAGDLLINLLRWCA
jgi:hypothetical protein